jgi:hypothetical protein
LSAYVREPQEVKRLRLALSPLLSVYGRKPPVVRAAPRSKPIREAQEVLLINLIEDCSHCVLDDFGWDRAPARRR